MVSTVSAHMVVTNTGGSGSAGTACAGGSGSVDAICVGAGGCTAMGIMVEGVGDKVKAPGQSSLSLILSSRARICGPIELRSD